MPDSSEGDDLTRLEKVLASSPRARSPLFRWLLDHFDEVSRLVRRYGRNWTAMAAGLNEMGVTRRNGAPVSPDSLRKTWSEVYRLETARRKEEAAAAARRRAAAEPPENAARAAAASGVSPEPEFTPARLKSGYRSTDAAAPGDADVDRPGRKGGQRRV
jgi:hypothetical protein